MKKVFAISFTLFFFCFNVFSMKIDNVILITVDTWRYDYFSYLYPENVKTPNIDNFAKKSLVFSNAFTTVPLTAPAHASIFTGVYPFAHGIRDNFGLKIKEDIKTLAEILEENGFETYGFVSASTLGGFYGFSRGFKIYDDKLPLPKEHDMAPSQRPGQETLKKVVKTLNWKNKCLLFIHFFEPHIPYEPPEKYKEIYPKNYYAGEVAYVDEIIGMFFKYLEENKIFDKSLIILTSDHGEGLGNHRESTHGYLTYNDTLKVPLMLFYPGVKHKILSYTVSHIDILPTIFNLLGIKELRITAGKNLLSDEKREIYFESLFAHRNFGLSKIKGIIKDSYKLHIKEKRELYNIVKDEKEINPLKDPKKEKELLKIFFSKFKVEKEEIGEIQEQKKNLYSLGYFGKADLKVHGDPVDLMDKIDLLEKARNLFFRKDFERAKLLYYDLLKFFPRSSIINDELGVALFYLNKLEEAEEKFQNAIKFNNNNVDAYVHLANLYQEKNMFDKALALYEKALKLNPKHPETIYNYAILCVKNKMEGKAKSLFKIYLEFYPDDPDREKIMEFLNSE